MTWLAEPPAVDPSTLTKSQRVRNKHGGFSIHWVALLTVTLCLYIFILYLWFFLLKYFTRPYSGTYKPIEVGHRQMLPQCRTLALGHVRILMSSFMTYCYVFYYILFGVWCTCYSRCVRPKKKVEQSVLSFQASPDTRNWTHSAISFLNDRAISPDLLFLPRFIFISRWVTFLNHWDNHSECRKEQEKIKQHSWYGKQS